MMASRLIRCKKYVNMLVLNNPHLKTTVHVCRRRKDWQEAHTLEAWTSAIAADVYRSGVIVTKRMDILVGHDVQHGDGESSQLTNLQSLPHDNYQAWVMDIPTKSGALC